MEEIMLGPKPLSIYLCLPENRLKPLAPLIRLVLRTLVTGLTTLHDTRKGKGCRPVLVLADEAGVAPVPALPELAATVCGRGMSIWADFQDLNQPKSLYGLDRARTLMNSMETQIFTRQSGLETSEYVERRLGTTSDFAHGISVHDDQTTESESEQAVSLLSPQEVAELSETEILCVHRNLKPFRATRMDWREYEALAALTKLSAPLLQALPPPPQIQPLAASTPASQIDFIDIDALQRKQRTTVSQRTAVQEVVEK